MVLLNKNNQKVKLADGLTEIGLSQVKSEIGGSGSSDPTSVVLKYILVSDPEDTGTSYVCDPVNFEQYIGDLGMGETITQEMVDEFLEKFSKDYNLEKVAEFDYPDLDLPDRQPGKAYLFSSDVNPVFVKFKAASVITEEVAPGAGTVFSYVEELSEEGKNGFLIVYGVDPKNWNWVVNAIIGTQQVCQFGFAQATL